MLRKITLCLAAGLALAPGAAHADWLLGLDVGIPLATATTALAASSPELWSAQAPQALRRGLIETGLLEQVNRAGGARTDREGALDVTPFSYFLAFTEAGVQYVLTFDADARLSYLLAKVPVPLASADPFDAARLRPLRGASRDLERLGLAPLDKDEHANVRTWRGQRGKGRLWARYQAEAEAVWLLLSPRGGGRS